MKTILIPTEDHASMQAVLETARLIAQRFGGYMEGFAVYPAASDFVAVDPVSSLTIASMQEGDEEIERRAQGLFESFMQAHKVPPAKPGPAAYSYGWVRPSAHGDAVIGSHGRRGLRRALLGSVAEAVMRQAPCPILVARAKE